MTKFIIQMTDDVCGIDLSIVWGIQC